MHRRGGVFELEVEVEGTADPSAPALAVSAAEAAGEEEVTMEAEQAKRADGYEQLDLEQLKQEAAKRNLEVRSANKEELKRMLRAGDVADKTLQNDAEQQPVENREAKIPPKVTAEEREKHERNHLSCRNWCEHCVKARARRRAHKRRNEEIKKEELQRVTRGYMELYYNG